MAERKVYTSEQKAEILKKVEETNVTTTSKEFGVSWAAIIKWLDSAKAEKAAEKVKAKAEKVKKNVKSTAKKADAVKTRSKKAAKTEVIIQSPIGGKITPEKNTVEGWRSRSGLHPG